MADARDSKSRPGNRVWVRVPPPAVFRRAYFVMRIAFIFFIHVKEENYYQDLRCFSPPKINSYTPIAKKMTE